MGFLKRIFSIGSKKSKKRPQIVHNVDAKLRALEEEEHEAAIGRLLRASSARYKVVSELDYASLPPLPHPIHEVIQPPSASTASLASSSISQRGTYTVTVHGRTRNAPTEFNNANCDCSNDDLVLQNAQSITGPNETSHLLGLRSDPSVVSLLEMYDEHGRIASDAFSNSPPSQRPEGRAQTRRTGSTLRQLLGNPTSSTSKDANDSGLGDISWAERFLGENTSISSSSSSDPQTPITPNTYFHPDDSQRDKSHNDGSLSTTHDLSIGTQDNLAISSMEVELSMSESLGLNNEYFNDRRPHKSPEPATPQRASEIFGFLTERRRSRLSTDLAEKTLPNPPSAFSISDHGSPREYSHFSDESVDATRVPSTLVSVRACFDTSASSATDEHLSYQSSTIPMFKPTPSTAAESRYPPPFRDADNDHSPIEQREPGNHIKVIMTAPTKVIVTAPTPSHKLDSLVRNPRGPRSQSRRASSELVERSHSRSSQSHDPDTYIVSQRRSHRTSSQNSSVSRHVGRNQPISSVRKHHRRASETRSVLMEINKENEKELSVQHKLPSTPLRSKSDSKSLFRAAVSPGTFQPPRGMTPSPASSSELSPVGRQLMMNIREQRSKARAAGRARSSGGGTRKR